MSVNTIEKNRTVNYKVQNLKSSNKTILLQLRRQMRLHYDIFKNGHMSKIEYLATIKPLDRHITNIEMSVL